MKEEFILEKKIVRVIFHLNNGYTQVIWQDSENTAWAGTAWMFDIPTHVIPFDLRIIGSYFFLSIKSLMLIIWKILNISEILVLTFLT